MSLNTTQNESRKLFTPLHLGNMNLSHRVIMSPLTRARCPGGLPTPLVEEYYSQRATEGGLIISEGMHPSLMAGNFVGVPGMFSPEHVRAWKRVTDAVHAKGAYMACQLWHTGRFAVSVQLGGRQPLSSSATNIGMSNGFTTMGRVPHEVSKAMSLQEIKDTVDDHVHAAKCAIEAGFDCVEITAGNGYLCDQFLNDIVNFRTDQYGGSKENRARFTLELLDAVVAAIGASKVALRFSPWGTVWLPLDSNPIETFKYVLSEVEKRGIAYVCLTQPRTDLLLDESVKWGNLYKAVENGEVAARVEDIHLRHFEEVLTTTPKLATGNYDGTNCFEEVERGEIDAVTFGRCFISNPDWVERLRRGRELRMWDKRTFYGGEMEGYTDYAVGEEI